MRFICDVHIPIKLSKFLIAQGAESWHMNQLLNGSETADTAICEYADTNDCIVITKDSDFQDSYFLRKTPKKLVRVCLGNIPNNALLTIITNILPQLEALNRESHFYLEIRNNQVLLFN